MLLRALQTTLEERRERGLLRTLIQETEPIPATAVDLSSNDYIGLARDAGLEAAINAEAQRLGKEGTLLLGATGSRLLTGDSAYARLVESELAAFHDEESALLFNSGYDANLSVFSCLPQQGGVVLFDELMHASCREGLKLCRSKTREFKHNDLARLEEALHEECDGVKVVLVAIESVYSMDGHLAPVQAMCALAQKYGAELIVDEAHGTGVYGPQGRGLCQAKNCRPFARVHTFGKAVGGHGAVVVGPPALRLYLLNYARPLIFSTALSTHSLVAIRVSYQYMATVADERQRKLAALVEVFQREVARLGISAAHSPSPIQAIFVPGNDVVVKAAKQLRGRGFWVLPIRAPSVPAGLERIRVVLHSYNTADDVVRFVGAVQVVLGAQ